jgi:lipopolysaccharide transport system ATP-binding protein
MRRIREFREGGGSILFVSHDLNAVKMLCDNVVLLHQGEVLDAGNPEAVVNRYNFLIAKLGGDENRLLSQQETSYGTFQAKIANIGVTGENSQSDLVVSGEKTIIRVVVNSFVDLPDVSVGILIRDRFGQDIFGTNTFHHGLTIDVEEKRTYAFIFAMPMNVGPGVYTVTAAVHTKDTHLEKCLHWQDSAATFKVAGNIGKNFVGVCRLDPEIQVTELETAKPYS